MNPKLSLGALSSGTTPATVDLTLDTTTAGSLDDTVRITSSQAGVSPIDIPISGTVVTASFITPNVMSLGTFCVGQPTTTSTLSLRSTGTATLHIPNAPAMASNPSPFTVGTGSFPTTLAPMDEVTAAVTPKRGTAAGSASDSLVWTTTEAGSGQSLVTATFVADGGAIAPSELDFGEVKIRLAVNNAMSVTLQNCDPAPLELVKPMAPAPFELGNEFPTTLNSGDTATFSVKFLPTETGHFQDTLVVMSKAGASFPVLLTGDGITGDGSGDDTGGPLDQTSFYACGGCASNDPSGVLAIAGVALFLRRTKKRGLTGLTVP